MLPIHTANDLRQRGAGTLLAKARRRFTRVRCTQRLGCTRNGGAILLMVRGRYSCLRNERTCSATADHLKVETVVASSIVRKSEKEAVRRA